LIAEIKGHIPLLTQFKQLEYISSYNK